MAEAARRRGRPEEALAGLERYKALAARLVELQPRKAEWLIEQGFAEINLGVVAYELREPRRALLNWQRARGVLEPLAAGNESARAALGNGLGWMARAHEELGQLHEALEALQAKVALLASNKSVDREDQFQRGLALSDRARLLMSLGRIENAYVAAAAAVVELRALAELDGSNREWLAGLAGAQVRAAEALLGLERPDDAAPLLEAAALSAGFDRDPGPAIGTGAMSLRAAWLTARARRMGPSQAPLDEMVSLLEAALADERKQPLRSTRARAVSGMALVLGDALAAKGLPVEARARWQQGLEVLGDPADDPQSVAVLAHLQQRLGDAQAAARLADHLRAGPCRHPLVLDLFMRMGRSL